MNQSAKPANEAVRTIPYASFPFDERESFQWLCRRKVKDPADFTVEGREHAPDPQSEVVHRDVIVRYRPTGKGRRYCPDYGKSWILKFADDLQVRYSTPQEAPPLDLRRLYVVSD